MAKTPTNPQFQYFQLRKGAGSFPGWGGLYLDGDAGSCPPNRFRRAKNIRFHKGNIYGRPGTTTMADLAGGTFYANNFPVGCPRKRLWLAIQGCFGVGAGTGTSILVFDTEVTPNLQTVSLYASDINSIPQLGNLGDQLYVGYNSLLREVPIVEAVQGVNPFLIGTSQANNPLKDFPGYRVVALREFPEIGTLFIGLQDVGTPANGLIVSYNGLSFTTEYTGLRPFAFGRWRNRMLAGFAGSISWRDNTSSTWTSVALGGFTCAPNQNAMDELRDKTYIAGGEDIIYTFDGTTLAVGQTIVGCENGGLRKGVTSCAMHQGLLYYVWNTPSTAFGGKVGRFDPDSSANFYVDTYKDLVGQNANWTELSGLVSYRSVLFTGRPKQTLIHSPMNDVKGTWVEVSGGGTGTNFPVVAMFPY